MLKAGKKYMVLKNGVLYKNERSDAGGKIHFSTKTEPGNEELIEISQ
jgi:hypothetical protein